MTLIDSAKAALSELERLKGSQAIILSLRRSIHEARFHAQFESAEVPPFVVTIPPMGNVDALHEGQFTTRLCVHGRCNAVLEPGWAFNTCPKHTKNP